MDLSFSTVPPSSFDHAYEVGHVSMLGFDPGPEAREQVRAELASYMKHGDPLWIVARDLDRPSNQEVGFISAVFIHDWVVEELMASDEPYLHPKFMRWLANGENPYVTGSGIGNGNANGGLNHLTVDFCWDARMSQNDIALVRSSLLIRYMETYGGFRYKRLLAEAYNEDSFRQCEYAGMRLLNRYRAGGPEATSPRLYGLTRDEAITGGNYFMMRLFAYVEPKFFFTDAQRAVLQAARLGATDQAIAAELCLSQEAIKKRWKAIYDRVEEVMPGFLPAGEANGRGPEKRRLLINHILNNPSELWPFTP